MSRSLVMQIAGKLSALCAVGLFGYFVGLYGSEGEGAVGLKEPSATTCSSVLPENSENGFTSVNAEVAKPTLMEKDSAKAVAESRNVEEGNQGALYADESAVVQESERLPDAEPDNEPAQRIRMLTAEKQLKYVKALAGNQDDASIAELKNLITFENEDVRHTAIDTLIKIMGQETGHYDAVEAALADNAVFLDDGQVEKFNKISSRVEKRGEKENPVPAF